VESAVVQEALGVLKAGKPKRLHYGVTDEAAWEVGLACGGQIDLWVEPLAAWRVGEPGTPSPYDVMVKALHDERPVVRAIMLRRGEVAGGPSAVFPRTPSRWTLRAVGEGVRRSRGRLLSGGVAAAAHASGEVLRDVFPT
jgi:xanthine/CO dehydrogenase XdhC/CoxF family maturation factor